MNQDVMLTASELSSIAEVLSDAGEEFDDACCNDFVLPLTRENKAIAIASIGHQVDMGWPDEESPENFIADVNASDDEIECFNNWLAAYLAQRCGKGAAPLNAAERLVIGELLEQLADLHDDDPAIVRLAARCKDA